LISLPTESDSLFLDTHRFDLTVYLGVSETHDAQAHIIEALTRNLPLENTVDLKKIASLCPLTYTGADFYALCSDAMHTAMSRTVDNVESKIGKL
jgi:peroxin-6